MYRVAILGAGIGQAHLDGCLACKEALQVAWICDHETSRARQLAAKTENARVTADIEDVLNDKDVDIVTIGLPPHLHVPISVKALDAGKHVVCEKPIAGSLTQAEWLRDVMRSSGRLYVPVFQYRYGRSVRQFTEVQKTGFLGKAIIGSLEVHWNRGADYYSNPWRGTWQTELGGAIVSHAIHLHDLAELIFGQAVAVTAELDTRVNAIETEDCAAITMKMASGALVTSSVTLGAADNTTRLRLVFEHATVESGLNPYAPGEAQWTYTARDPGRQGDLDALVASAKTTVSTQAEGFAGLFHELNKALAGTPNRGATLEDGVRSIELASALYEASRTGVRVALPLDRSLAICEGFATHS